MTKSLTITAKELKTIFQSPTAYILALVCMCVFNVFFFMLAEQHAEASLRQMFQVMEFMFVFIAPILTMRLIAEEKRSGTIEFLVTCPLREIQIIMGKFWGAYVFFCFLIALTIPYYGLVEAWADPDRLPVLTGYIGLLLEGMVFVSVGLLCSALTRSHVTAAIISYAVLLFMYLSVSFIQYTSGPLREVLQYASLWYHQQHFSKGLIYISDIVYYLSLTGFCLYVTRLIMKNQRP